ncbi:hypothetical protein JDV02_004748 [Purpureocillium takamizusanense]|uniref:Uncharacterized protein n=1 Tax=Purpureocillium takamizusanense TaxID=2060973 RepID=A0A9Q8VB59_9HYPO|nr:uncharacterized protein JDV02_004748 [Purpureocillium takamizusanense]UNI18482.1 hypothetical protein JDV02_004748 [Purpureocillium takamizusanense]
MARPTVLVQHTPLWNARATTVMEAYRNRSLLRDDRRPSTAEGACGCRRHLQMSSSCGMHPDDSSHHCFGESYHGGRFGGTSLTTAACHGHHTAAATTLPDGTRAGVAAGGQDGCECNTARLFETLDIHDMAGHLWILAHLGATDEERASLHRFLHDQQQRRRGTAREEPAPRPVVAQSTLAQPYKRRCVGADGASMPVDDDMDYEAAAAYDQESREFGQWMWDTWDYYVSPYQPRWARTGV